MEKVKKFDLIFVSPHLDDAVLSCGGLMAKSVAEGKKVLVLTVFNEIDVMKAKFKARKYVKECGYIDMETLHKDRMSEDKQACELLGVDYDYLNLIEWDYREEERVSLDKVDKYIQKHLKKGGVVYLPLGLGGHKDHMLLNKIEKRFDCIFWEDYPYLLYRVSENRQKIKKYKLKKREDVRYWVDRKEQAIRCYRSQMGPLFKYKKMYLSGFENYYQEGRAKRNRIHLLTDELEGGAKRANDYLAFDLGEKYKDRFNMYEQVSPIFKGVFKKIREQIWSVANFHKFLVGIKNNEKLVITSPNALVAIRLLGGKYKKVIYIIHADRGRPIPRQGTIKWLYWWLYKLIDKWGMPVADVVVVPSEAAKKMAQERYGDEISRKIKIIKLGVDRSMFRDLKIKRNEGEVMYCGRVDRIKGLELLEKMAKLVKSARLVKVVPPTPDAEIVRRYNQAECVVIPSESETFSLVLLEALACGCLVIGFNTGEIGVALSQLDKNLILKQGSAEEMADKIRYVLQMDYSRKKEILSKTDALLKAYDWKKFAKGIEEELVD